MYITHTINKILHSRLLSNLTNQTLLYGFSHIVPLLLVPFLINTIGIEKYGIVNFALAFSFYFQVFNEFGFNLSNVRHVVLNRGDNKKLSEILSSIILCELILSCASGIVFFALVLSLHKFEGEFLIYVLAFLRILGIILTPLWLFRSMEEIKYITRITVPIKFILTLPIFFLVKTPNDYLWVMTCFTAESVVSGIVTIFVAINHYNLSLKKQSIKTLFFYWKDSSPFFASTFLQRIYQNSNPVLVGFLLGDAAVGIYTAAEKLYSAYASFFAPIISQVFYPYFQRIKSITRINRIVLATSIINIILLLLLAFISPYVIGFVINNMTDEIIFYFNLFLVILAISIPNEILGFPYLGVLGRINDVAKSTLWSAIGYFVVIGICMMFMNNISMFLLALLVAQIIGFTYRVICIYNTINYEIH